MNRKYYTGVDLLEEIKKRNVKEDTKIFNINADTTFIYKNGNLYNCYDNKLIGSLLEIVDCEFMVLEDNTEEIEELPINDEDEKLYSPVILDNRLKINELVKVVKEIRKDLNKEHCCCCGVEITDENRALHNMCNECKYGIDWEEKSK